MTLQHPHQPRHLRVVTISRPPRDLPPPPSHKRHPMSPPVGPFQPPRRPRCVVPKLRPHLPHTNLRPIVARENDQRICPHSQPIHRPDQLPHHSIRLHHQVAIPTHSAHRVIQKKPPPRMRPRMLLQKPHRSLLVTSPPPSSNQAPANASPPEAPSSNQFVPRLCNRRPPHRRSTILQPPLESARKQMQRESDCPAPLIRLVAGPPEAEKIQTKPLPEQSCGYRFDPHHQRSIR